MNRFVINKYTIEKLLPFFCGCVVYKTFFYYFVYLVPALESLWVLLYNLVTLILLVSYVPMAIYVFLKGTKYKVLRPALIIPLFVVINIVAAMFETGDLSILSRSHFIPMAAGTIDATGYYFSQINTWFGNMSVVLMIYLFSTEKETIKKCVLYSAFMLVLPAFLVAITHPEFLGRRQASIEGTDVIFSGGLWNIGVMGFGSIAWLGLALTRNMSKNQKRFMIIAVVLLAFLGVAGLSRTLILMLALSACTYFLIAKKDGRLLSKVLLVFLAIVAFIVLETDMVASVMSRFGDDSVGSHFRLYLWKGYMANYKETWLYGAPYGSIYNYFHDVDLFGVYYMPHSAIINYYLRFGIFATLAYLTIIKNAFFSFRIGDTFTRNQYACIMAAFVAYVSLAFINQTGYADAIFYMMFGLLLAYSHVYQKTDEELQ